MDKPAPTMADAVATIHAHVIDGVRGTGCFCIRGSDGIDYYIDPDIDGALMWFVFDQDGAHYASADIADISALADHLTVSCDASGAIYATGPMALSIFPEVS